MLCSTHVKSEFEKKCRTCFQPILEEYIRVDGTYMMYHNHGGCVTCHACGSMLESIDNAQCRGLDGWIYCDNCATVWERPSCVLCLEPFYEQDECCMIIELSELPMKDGTLVGYDGRLRAHKECTSKFIASGNNV